MVTTEKLCPVGWHVPTIAELDEICCGVELKATTDWTTPGSNSTGFTALPAGKYVTSSNYFDGMGNAAYFWSSSPNGSNGAYYKSLEEGSTVWYSSHSYADKYSVRCLRNR